MYTQFYGFSERPFSLLPDPDYLFFSRQHEAALAMLETAVVNGAGFCMLSGEIGAGKTTLLRELLNRLDNDITIGLVSNTHASFGNLMQWILAAFGMVPESQDRVEQHQQFVDFLIAEYAKKRRTLLIIDEAQQLTPEAMDELRLLSNINSDKDFLLQVIIAGQHELRDMLKKPELRQFAQRISFDFHLEYLDQADTCRYIKHRLQHAGGDPELFDKSACEAVFENTNGVPRLINRLCDFCLVYGYAEEMNSISDHTVYAVMEGNQTGGFIHMCDDIEAREIIQQPKAASVDTGEEPVDIQESLFAQAADQSGEERPPAVDEAAIESAVDDALESLDVFGDFEIIEPEIESFEVTERNEPDVHLKTRKDQTTAQESRKPDDSFVMLDEDETVMTPPHEADLYRHSGGSKNRRVFLPVMLIAVFTATSIYAVLDIANRTPESLSGFKQKIHNLVTNTFRTSGDTQQTVKTDEADFAGMQTSTVPEVSSPPGDSSLAVENSQEYTPEKSVENSSDTTMVGMDINQSLSPAADETQQTESFLSEIQAAVNAFERETGASEVESIISKEAESLSIDTASLEPEEKAAMTSHSEKKPDDKISAEMTDSDVGMESVPVEIETVSVTDALPQAEVTPVLINQENPENDGASDTEIANSAGEAAISGNARDTVTVIDKTTVAKNKQLTTGAVNPAAIRSDLVQQNTVSRKPAVPAVTNDSVAARRAAAHAALMRDRARREALSGQSNVNRSAPKISTP